MARELLLRNGHYWDGTAVVRGDLLIADGRIRALGAPDAPIDSIPPGAADLDLGGHLILPGFIDAHIHPHSAGRTMLNCDLSAASTADEYLSTIARYAQQHPGRDWILGAGWSMDAFPGGIPTAELLDRAVPGRAVYLVNRDTHGAWVSTEALERAGITARTPDPADGRIERAADGTPIGCLQEGAMRLVSDHLPPVDEDLLDEALLAAQQQLFAWGVTGWQDAMVGAYSDSPDNFESYRRLCADGRLAAHVRGALWWDRHSGLEQIDRFRERREATRDSDRFHADSVKIMVDGVAENFTAALLEPYVAMHHCEGGDGTEFIAADDLTEIVSELHRSDFQVHFHALGDRAVRHSLDAIETARDRFGAKDLRHHLSHLQVIDDADLGRFAELDAIANIQPYWARHAPQVDDLTSPFLGDARAPKQYPFAAIQLLGGRLVSGSDWPVSTADPIQIIHTAVNRSNYGSPRTDPLGGEYALSLPQAVTSYTSTAAFVNHDPDTGSIREGLRADLAVLDRNIFAAPVSEVAAASVSLTVVDGEIVYEAP